MARPNLSSRSKWPRCLQEQARSIWIQSGRTLGGFGQTQSELRKPATTNSPTVRQAFWSLQLDNSLRETFCSERTCAPSLAQLSKAGRVSSFEARRQTKNEKDRLTNDCGISSSAGFRHGAQGEGGSGHQSWRRCGRSGLCSSASLCLWTAYLCRTAVRGAESLCGLLRRADLPTRLCSASACVLPALVSARLYCPSQFLPLSPITIAQNELVGRAVRGAGPGYEQPEVLPIEILRRN